MNDDFLEKELGRRPLRSLPSAWKEEILGAARQARAEGGREEVGARGTMGFWEGIWRSGLWPHPAAWGALAALWLVIALLQWSSADGTNGPARSTTAAANGSLPSEREDTWLDLWREWNELAKLDTEVIRPDPVGAPRSAADGWVRQA